MLLSTQAARFTARTAALDFLPFPCSHALSCSLTRLTHCGARFTQPDQRDPREMLPPPCTGQKRRGLRAQEEGLQHQIQPQARRRSCSTATRVALTAASETRTGGLLRPRPDRPKAAGSRPGERTPQTRDAERCGCGSSLGCSLLMFLPSLRAIKRPDCNSCFSQGTGHS